MDRYVHIEKNIIIKNISTKALKTKIKINSKAL